MKYFKINEKLKLKKFVNYKKYALMKLFILVDDD
jgi:hypothetical protein